MSKLTYHPLRVAKVVEETADARSLVFEVPDALRDAFTFKPGQHLQLHVPCGAKPLPRCYSLSSIAGGGELRVTVKRTADGRASNWLCGTLRAGDTLEVAPPAGVFTPKSYDGDFLMFAGGSGITPVWSIIQSVIRRGRGRVRLVYANRDERSVIFGAALSQLAREHPTRLQVIHWLDAVQGFPARAQLAALAAGWEQAECWICGPGVYMDAASGALHDLGLPSSRIHIERFVSLPEDADDDTPRAAPPASADGTPAGAIVVEAHLDGVDHVVECLPGQLVIEALEAAGLEPPYSCRAGACAACMCKLEDGEVAMEHNHVLEQSDLDEGWILACQALPKSARVKIRYPD